MLKRFITGALALVLLCAPVAAAGLWPLSFTQRHDLNGNPYPGAKAYFYDAETGDPITVYREYSLATPHPNPVSADGNGVFPAVYVGTETFYRFRVTTSAGVVLSDTQTIPNIGPTDGEGGDPAEPVEATALAKTGDLKARYGTGILEGWLPLNGRTMGSATSGADYASGDNEALFLYLWAADTTLSVVGGRGANAAADWAANKRLTLPDASGRSLAGLDNMSGSARSVLTILDTLGEKTGAQAITLTAGQIPQITGTAASDGAHTHTMTAAGSSRRGSGGSNVGTSWYGSSGDTSDGGTAQVTSASSGAHTHTVTAGASSPSTVSLVQPVLGITIYIKL